MKNRRTPPFKVGLGPDSTSLLIVRFKLNTQVNCSFWINYTQIINQNYWYDLLLQVETYRRRKSLVHAIIDKKRMMSILNRFAMTSIIAISLLSSLVKGMATSTALVSLVPQLYLLGYAFRKNIKNILDSILFVFVAHPFDVGDCCVIDDTQVSLS